MQRWPEEEEKERWGETEERKKKHVLPLSSWGMQGCFTQHVNCPTTEERAICLLQYMQTLRMHTTPPPPPFTVSQITTSSQEAACEQEDSEEMVRGCVTEWQPL